jgi:RNA polymerase sigma factor (sigma-70 family)
MPVARARRSDPRPLSVSRRALVERYLPMAYALARPFVAVWPAIAAELDAEAAYALVRAAARWQPRRGVKFSTYARHRVIGSLQDLVRARHARTQRQRLAIQLLARRPRRAPADPVEMHDLVENLLRALTPRLRSLMLLIYRDGLNQREAADALEIGESTASHWRHEAIDLMRDRAARRAT